MEQINRFFVIESCDGCGKTTLIHNLCKLFKERDGFEPLCLKEPYEELEIGKYVRQWVDKTDFSENVYKVNEALLLFSSARMELLEKVIVPALIDPTKPPVILCDRFIMSTCVYQGVSPEWDTSFLLKGIVNTVAKFIKVDATIHLNLSPKKIMERLGLRAKEGGVVNPMDRKTAEWFSWVNEAYKFQLQEAGHPKEVIGRLYEVDAKKEPMVIAEEVYKKLKRDFKIREVRP